MSPFQGFQCGGLAPDPLSGRPFSGRPPLGGPPVPGRPLRDAGASDVAVVLVVVVGGGVVVSVGVVVGVQPAGRLFVASVHGSLGAAAARPPPTNRLLAATVAASASPSRDGRATLSPRVV